VPTVVENVEDLAGLVGADFGTTDWVEVDQSSINCFARTTHDEQWLHVDPERASRGPFGAPIAHGYFTLALCSHFRDELIDVRGAGMIVNYGLDRVRFPSPVLVGSRVRASGVLISAEQQADCIQVVFRLTIKVDGSSKPVCIADQVTRFYPPSSADSC
jgi:acyl dehydratase